MGDNKKSAWIHYPDKFKFYSVHFLLDPTVRITERETYDFFAFASDVGGALEFLKTVFGLLILPFSSLRMKALLANRLFHISMDT